MATARATFVHEADLRLDDGADPAAPGGAVTAALCGHWEHEGPCRWPHNNDIAVSTAAATFRTLFAAPAADEGEVRRRIDDALANGADWALLGTRPRAVALSERPLAERLLALPSADD
jgi:hypothetical protein